MIREVSVHEFLSLMNKENAWAITIQPDIRRYLLSCWAKDQITAIQYQTPDMLDLSHADFQVLMAGLQDIMEEGKHTEPEPKIFNSSELTLAVQEIDEDGNAGAITYVPPGGSYPETPKRLHPERWSWFWEDENSDGVLQ